MARLIWAAPALADLDEIAEYIALDDRPAAARYVRQVFDTVDRLKRFPNSGRRPAELPDSRYREVVVPPCRVFYRTEGGGVYMPVRQRPGTDVSEYALDRVDSEIRTVLILYVMRSERLLHTHLLDNRRRRTKRPERE